MGRVIRYSWLMAALAVAGCSSSGVIGASTSAVPTSPIANTNTSTNRASNAPSAAQLQTALLASTDSPALGTSHSLDYRIGMNLYPTNGTCAPMDQLAQKMQDGGADFPAPTASIGFDLPAADGGSSSDLLGESVEYYGSTEAAALISQFHAMEAQCQKPFQAPEAGSPSDSYMVQPTPDHVAGNCVEYYFDKAGQQPHYRYVVDQVGGLLLTFSAWSLDGPPPPVDASLIAAAEKKAQAADVTG